MQTRNVFLAALACAASFVVSTAAFAADDNYSVSSGKQESTKKTPDIDKSQKPEKEEKPQRTDTNYDVKKSHDEHIPATEKAAGEAAERNK